MQTFNPELTRHMDARREQRQLAADWRLARAAKGNDAAPTKAGPGAAPKPVTSGAAAVVRA
ncbi:MAG: hypothetical protein ABIZ50_05320 [Solirubrobacterales bacterium]